MNRATVALGASLIGLCAQAALAKDYPTVDVRVVMKNGQTETIEVSADASGQDVELSAQDTARRHHSTVVDVVPVIDGQTLADRECKLFRKEKPRITAELHVMCIAYPDMTGTFKCAGHGPKQPPVEATKFGAWVECQAIDDKIGR